MTIVKFVAIGSKIIIEDQHEYVDNILIELEAQGYIDNYEIFIEEEYPTAFFSRTDKAGLTFDIIFEFETYRGVKQLVIDIASNGYMIDVDNSYLENLKLMIKKSIIKDWDKIVWLYDDDAYILSKDLYSRFYVTEVCA